MSAGQHKDSICPSGALQSDVVQIFGIQLDSGRVDDSLCPSFRVDMGMVVASLDQIVQFPYMGNAMNYIVYSLLSDHQVQPT